MLAGLIAVLMVVALLVEYFPGRNRRRRGSHSEVPFMLDSDFSDHRHGDDNDGGWFDGGDCDDGD